MVRPRMAAIAFVFAAMTWPLMMAQPADADIVFCSRYPKPATEKQALKRSAIAFDGVVTAGRERTGGNPGELISPFTFRVLRWIKGGPAPGSMVRMWDSRYARLPDRLLASYSTQTRKRFPGEITTTAGQKWRIYSTNENGANFTCTDYLGSHPLEDEDASSGVSWPLALAAAGGIALVLLSATVVARKRAAG